MAVDSASIGPHFSPSTWLYMWRRPENRSLTTRARCLSLKGLMVLKHYIDERLTFKLTADWVRKKAVESCIVSHGVLDRLGCMTLCVYVIDYDCLQISVWFGKFGGGTRCTKLPGSQWMAENRAPDCSIHSAVHKRAGRPVRPSWSWNQSARLLKPKTQYSSQSDSAAEGGSIHSERNSLESAVVWS